MPSGSISGLSALPSSQGLYGFVGFFMAKAALDKLVAAGPCIDLCPLGLSSLRGLILGI